MLNFITLVKSTRRESPYEALGVSPSANRTEIKKAYSYRKLALKYHPMLTKRKQRDKDEEELYGLEDFLRIFKKNTRTGRQVLLHKLSWEELVEIGEEFVEFLGKEMNINDADIEAGNYEGPQKSNANHGMKGSGSSTRNESVNGSSIEENIDDVEAALAQLIRELGL